MRKLLFLIAAGMVAGYAQDAPASQDGPTFEVASIKPNHAGGRGAMIGMQPGGRFSANNIPLQMLITYAYGIRPNQLSGAPGWVESERYDINAKPGGDVKDVKPEQIKLMVRAMLAERFKLTLRRESKEQPIYALVVAKNGPKLVESKGGNDVFGDGARPPAPTIGEGRGRGPMRQGMRMGRGEITAADVEISFLADTLGRILGRNVIDKTGLTGKYDFTLKYAPDESQNTFFGLPPGPGDGNGPPPADASAPSIFVAVEEQLGLKLEAQKGPVDVYVIDHIERPSEN